MERVPIVGWLDFGALLDPATNAANRHPGDAIFGTCYDTRIVNNAAYPVFPAAGGRAAWRPGGWLFKRRPQASFAQKGGGRIWTVVHRYAAWHSP